MVPATFTGWLQHGQASFLPIAACREDDQVAASNNAKDAAPGPGITPEAVSTRLHIKGE